MEAWKDDFGAKILKNETIYANYINCCNKHLAENGMTIATKGEQFFSTHEEADIRMFFHLNYALPGNTVVMWTDNTDSLVIASGCKPFFNTSKIWLEVKLEWKLMRGTPSISHTLAGCNYTTSFSKKGKVPPLKLLQKNIEAQIVLREL